MGNACSELQKIKHADLKKLLNRLVVPFEIYAHDFHIWRTYIYYLNRMSDDDDDGRPEA